MSETNDLGNASMVDPSSLPQAATEDKFIPQDQFLSGLRNNRLERIRELPFGFWREAYPGSAMLELFAPWIEQMDTLDQELMRLRLSGKPIATCSVLGQHLGRTAGSVGAQYSRVVQRLEQLSGEHFPRILNVGSGTSYRNRAPAKPAKPREAVGSGRGKAKRTWSHRSGSLYAKEVRGIFDGKGSSTVPEEFWTPRSPDKFRGTASDFAYKATNEAAIRNDRVETRHFGPNSPQLHGFNERLADLISILHSILFEEIQSAKNHQACLESFMQSLTNLSREIRTITK